MIIFNEKEYIEEILNTGHVPNEVTMTQLITYLTKYFYYNGITAKELYRTVSSTMDAFNLDTLRYRPFRYEAYIKKITKRIVDDDAIMQPLREYESIPIYQSEINKIKQCRNRRQQKLLATLIFLGRYNYNLGFTTESVSVISKLANISASKKDVNRTAYELSKLEDSLFKGMNYNSDKACTWFVELSDGTDDDVVYEFNKPSNIGNQTIAIINPEYISCEVCGRLVKKTNSYDKSRKYCKRCAEEINREKTRNNMKKRYNEIKKSLKA